MLLVMIIFISPIIVVQIQFNQTTKIKYEYLINLTRKKEKRKEITTNIHYNISKYSSINQWNTS